MLLPMDMTYCRLLKVYFVLKGEPLWFFKAFPLLNLGLDKSVMYFYWYVDNHLFKLATKTMQMHFFIDRFMQMHVQDERVICSDIA